nr:MAG TPA: hypothetical protein [Caudoviricetes sp.]
MRMIFLPMSVFQLSTILPTIFHQMLLLQKIY